MCVTSITSTTSTVPQTQTQTGTRRTRTQKQHQQQQLLLLLPPPLLLLIILIISSLLFLSHFEVTIFTTSTTSTTTTVNAFSISSSLYTNLRRSNNNPIMMMKATKLNEDEVAEDEIEVVVENENETENNNDPLLTPIPQEWYDELPRKLAYPFWYDPHPIAKKCCDQLKEELPPYYNHQNNQTTTNTIITLGKMYGVLVVSLDTEKKKQKSSTKQKQQLFYLKAYSGTMPRPQYGGSMITNEEMFVPLVYDRFASISPVPSIRPSLSSAPSTSSVPSSSTDLSSDRSVQPSISTGPTSLSTTTTTTTDNNNEERFCYENEEENLNYLTKEIEKYKDCPKRIKEQNQFKEIEIELLKQLTDGKQQQNNNKSNRKKRRDRFRQQLINEQEQKQKQLNNSSSSSNSSSNEDNYYNTNMNKKESHKYFLEHNNKYRILEDQLVQESAYDQRQFKTIKYNVQDKLDEIKLKINGHEEQILTLKKQRKQGSIDMQRKLFDEYKLLNVYGETKTPVEIFKDTILKIPPSGAGDCSAIKLFQYAFSKGYHPIALAEFWWGPSPHNINNVNNNNNNNNNSNNDGEGEGSEVARTHGNYYPCCRGKCEPILSRHMLLGTDVESDPLTEGIMLSKKRRRQQQEDGGQLTSVLSIVYEDDWLVVVNKPHNVLSVPGRNIQDSIYTELKQQYPNATGPLLVHRLDYSTSGLLLATKDSNTHKHVQAQFIQRTVKKRYTALLEGNLLMQSNHTSNSINNNNTMMMKGTIDLPLAGDYLNRPMQKVDRGPEGKPAVTHYEIINEGREEDSSPANATSVDNKDDTDTDEKKNNKIKNTVDDDGRKRTRIHFYPVTGRTHQLRVHASHPEGLGIAIVGDDIYGQRDKRLCLHAGFLQIDHPKTGKRITFTAPIPF